MHFPLRRRLKPTTPLPRASLVSHVATGAIVSMFAASPAWAFDLSALGGLRSTHAGWTVLAGIGLVAVAIAAFRVRRPRLDEPQPNDAPLGQMRVDVQRAPLADVPSVARNQAPALPADALPLPEPQPQPSPPVIPLHESTTAPPALVAQLSDEVPATVPALPSARVPAKAPESGSQLFLALQHVDLSIDVLRRHLQREPRPMPAVWLMLLDLCRTHGREQTFQELAVEFHRHFNVCTPEWEGFPPGREDPGLEAYPRLVKEITLAWGTHECRRLLERLLYDNRGTQRKGFTLNAYNDLIALRRAADAVLESIEKDVAPAVEGPESPPALDATTLPRAIAKHANPSPLVSDLESQLESDLRNDATPQSAIEREHPALAGMLAREWGNAAVAARLCDMLARGGDSTHSLSPEASQEIDMLRGLAEKLSEANGFAVTTTDPN